MPDLVNRPELPEIFPQDEVTVEGEEHTFKVSELDTGTQAQYEYTLDKAPIEEIQSVQGVDQDGNSRTFSNGVDYELTAKSETVISDFDFDEDEDEYLLRYPVDTGTDSVTDDSGDSFTRGTDYAILDSEDHYGDMLVWLDGGDTPQDNETFTAIYEVTFPSSVLQWQTDGENLPQANSLFYVTYRADSIISRYLDAHEDELDDVEDALQEVINNKFLDSASGDGLDELGKLFGPTIGKRRGRSDAQYRIYLKSVVQSFVSRGTVNGIKLAISAATEVPLEDIVINEDFEQVQYEVQVQAATPVTVELLEEVAEIADPSGVDQVRTRFITDPDLTEVNDQISVTEGQQLFDDMTVADTVANYGFGTEGAVFEDITSDDAVLIDPNQNTASDDMTSDDATAINPNTFTVADDMTSLDAVATPRGEANETITVDEAVALDPNLTTTTDVSGMADTGVANRVEAIEDSTIQETIATSESKVSWDEANWDEFDWATENN